MDAATLSVPHATDLMDHGDLSAIAAFNKAHDESQRAIQQAAQPQEKPIPAAQPRPAAQQPLKAESQAVKAAPAAPIVTPAPVPQRSAPVAASAPAVAHTPITSVSTAGVKRPAETPAEALASPSKRQQIYPPPPLTPQSRTREVSVASQTAPVETPRLPVEEPTPTPRQEYVSDSDDDYEKESADDSLPGASGYSFSNSFSNGQLLDPSQHLRIQSLPILDNLSSQLLSTLLQGQFQDTLVTVTQPETDQGQAYATLKALFWQTKRLYSSEPFLSTDELRFQVPEHRNMIRQVNMATFVTSLFGSNEVGFFHLNQYFLPTFVPEGGRLLKNQGNLFLGLKTQAYISALETADKTKEQLLNDLFENDIATKLTDRRAGSKELIPSEVEFLNRVKNRRDALEKAPPNASVLREVYSWQDWLREIVQYVAKHRESILAATTRRKLKRLEAAQENVNKHMFQAQSQASGSLYGQHSSLYPPPPGSQPVYPGYSSVGRPSMHATYSSHTAAPGISQTSLSGTSPNPALSVGASQAAVPHPEQTTPTHILYEQARLAATARQSPNARRAGLPSQRRPWSTEEEHALMVGLDYVKGPHWSQILAMFGAGGTVSEALKDRNQVQLKDKARNLKLFFLKSGMEVPYYLQFVTGELKTRAPGQVAKNEKRKQQEEEAIQNRATVDALNVLAGGASNGEGGPVALRHHSQPMLQPPRPQPTPVPTAHHPQRWAMSQSQPVQQAQTSVVTPKTEPSSNHHPSTQSVQRQQVQHQPIQHHAAPAPAPASTQQQITPRASQAPQSQPQPRAAPAPAPATHQPPASLSQPVSTSQKSAAYSPPQSVATPQRQPPAATNYQPPPSAVPQSPTANLSSGAGALYRPPTTGLHLPSPPTAPKQPAGNTAPQSSPSSVPVRPSPPTAPQQPTTATSNPQQSPAVSSPVTKPIEQPPTVTSQQSPVPVAPQVPPTQPITTPTATQRQSPAASIPPGPTQNAVVGSN